ncbi:MAG: enoyl-CoA hydratase/isomerase family protein [Gammaproteobacteria bacterium]
MDLDTLVYETGADHVATITLNRPAALNAFNHAMCEEFRRVWAAVRDDDDVHAVVLRGAGERGFSAGLDRKDPYRNKPNVWDEDGPLAWMLPKTSRVWKPVICAVHGIAVGGALYWVGESDIVICSDDAQFCDPHVSLGFASARIPGVFARRIPLAEAMRIALMGADEWLGARRAFEIGLVSEVVPRARLHERAHAIAAQIAAKPPAAVQATVRAVWDSLDQPLGVVSRNAGSYSLIANPIAARELAAAPPGTGSRERTVR